MHEERQSDFLIDYYARKFGASMRRRPAVLFIILVYLGGIFQEKILFFSCFLYCLAQKIP